MIIYWTIIILILFFAYLAEIKKSKIFLFIVALALSLLTGLRGKGVGIDTEHYYTMFNNIYNGVTVYVRETSFVWIVSILMKLFKQEWVLILIFSTIICFFFVYRLWDFRDKSSFTILVLIFIVFNLYPLMNTMRQYIALSITFYFSRYIWKRKYFRYLFSIVIACLFHYSAFIALAVLPIYILVGYANKQKKILVLLIILLLLPFVIAVGLNILDSYSKYFETTNVEIGFMTIYKMLVVSFFAIFSLHLYKKKDFETYKQMKTISLIYVLGLLLTSVGYFYSFMGRIGYYFSIFEIPFWGVILKDKKYGVVYKLAFIIMIIYSLFSLIMYDGYGVQPFYFLWQNI